MQYKNGKDDKPQVNDLIVFPYTKYGHVAIVSEVGNDYIQIVQQNVGTTTRAKYELKHNNGTYTVENALGWLRKK